MRMGNKESGFIFFFFFIIFFMISSVNGYKNYTVGDTLGWYDLLENPKVDYHRWASAKNFSLGDFLIFNSDNNHSVIQTYNFTTYNLCDYDDALDNDTVEWSSADPSSTAPHPITVAVPLMKVGPTYFFSSDYDGEQCLNGQRFGINVTRGQGLPPSLRPDNNSSPAPVSPDSGDDDSAPETLVPSNFDNPKDTTSDDEDDNKSSNSSVPLVAISKLMFGVQLHGLMLVVVGYFILCC